MNTIIEQDLVAATRDLGPTLRANAQRSDRDGRLPAESVAARREAGILWMWVPRSLGGLESAR